MENRAFNMDCLEAMRSMPDQCFDLAVVDPPYGVGSVTYMPRTREKAHGGFIDKYNITIATLDMNQRGKVKANIIPGWTGEGTIKNFGDDNISPGPEYFEAQEKRFKQHTAQLSMFGGGGVSDHNIHF